MFARALFPRHHPQPVHPALPQGPQEGRLRPGCVLPARQGALFQGAGTQKLLKDSAVDLFDNTQWPGDSPDSNPTDSLGAMLKERAETNLHIARDNSSERLRRAQEEELRRPSTDVALFSSLLVSFPARLQAVCQTGGGHTFFLL